ncbi:MAG: hypothetical protein KTV77_04105 [Wolbachia endosymbiont of Fragariocoptes setiger]|nr:hypothetical protein [Wolbachia endosymbiont of Fragariocoptes setiger]
MITMNNIKNKEKDENKKRLAQALRDNILKRKKQQKNRQNAKSINDI